MYRLRRRKVRIAIATVVMLVATGAVTVGVSNAAPTGCASVHFVGARGSSEPAGLGGTLLATYTSLAAKTRGVRAISLDYPAATVPVPGRQDASAAAFVASVDTGVDNLRIYLERQSQRCPQQTYVLSGYSQGAIVVDRVLPQLSPQLAERIDGVALFGDPRFEPTFKNNKGTFDPALGGVDRKMWGLLQMPLDAAYVPAAFADKTASYCLSGDLVCNYSWTNQFRCLYSAPQQCPHGAYISSGSTDQAADFLRSRIEARSR